MVSYKEKLLKPEKEIYEKILYRYSLEPGETLFIDDMEQNIEAAIKFGLKGIVLKEPRKLEDELQKFDINI
ncbi:HAD superfamily hydrolase (TIGR01509 family) [Clostridium beijerinckii]|nr:HAD superfamily hydrolase (TIGR01509 family) [Clostridium beijerinckii]